MTSAPKKTCFVIMPFSDMEGYESGHFTRVYEHVIRPACAAAGVDPIRGDEVKGTNYIAVDILQRILKSDLVVCDLSGKNANVMYELGVRQAFDLPVVLIKDRRTERVFDIQGLRTLDYTESLRVDSVKDDCSALTQAIAATLRLGQHEINSLVGLLGVEKAALGKPTEVSSETALILDALKDISARLTAVEETPLRVRSVTPPGRVQVNVKSPTKVRIKAGQTLTLGEEVFDLSAPGASTSLGVLIGTEPRGLVIKPAEGPPYVLPNDDARFESLSEIPF